MRDPLKKESASLVGPKKVTKNTTTLIYNFAQLPSNFFHCK